jgi:hypothetical protein
MPVTPEARIHRAAEINARHARDEARKAVREADRAEARAHGRCGWKAMAGPRNRRQRSGNALAAA